MALKPAALNTAARSSGVSVAFAGGAAPAGLATRTASSAVAAMLAMVIAASPFVVDRAPGCPVALAV
jgi:hypothetical protein